MESSRYKFDQTFDEKLSLMKKKIQTKKAEELSFQDLWLLSLSPGYKRINYIKTFNLVKNGSTYLLNEAHSKTSESDYIRKTDKLITIMKCAFFINLFIILSLIF